MTKTHQGGCHCKAVRYEVEVDLEQPVIECNCSYCAAKGYLLAFVPAEKFSLLSGEDALTEYRFNTGRIAHQFCKVCGIGCFGKGEHNGTDMRAINVRSLDDVNLEALTRKHVNGKEY